MILVHSCVRGKILEHLFEGKLRSDDVGAFMCEG